MSLIKSIATVGGFTLLSRLVGFVRDIMIAAFLGATMWADAFFMAWRFPNLFRSLFAEGTLNVSFVPIFTDILNKKGKEKARLFAKEAFSALFYILLILTILMEIFMPYAMLVLAPGFDSVAGKIEATTLLSRITFPFLMAVSLVSLFSCMLNSVGKFAAAAFSPCLLNLAMIASLLIGTPFCDEPAISLAWGVFAAGLIEFVWLAWNVKKQGLLFNIYSPIKTIFHKSQDLLLLFRRMLPGIFGSGIYQINLFLDSFFVSFVGAGAMSWLNYSHHLFQLPIGIIGVAIGTALLPVLSSYLQSGQIQKANYDLNRGLEVAFFMSLASMLGLIVLATPIVSVLFERGAFTVEDTVPTARALQAFAIGLPAYMLTKAISPYFYAQGDTKTPVKIATVGVFLNAILCLIFLSLTNLGHVGIALATGITVWVNALQYVFYVRKNDKFKLDDLFKYRFIRICMAGILMTIFLIFSKEALYYLLNDWLHLPYLLSFVILGLLITMACGLYCGILILSGGLKVADIRNFLKKKKEIR